MALQVTYNFRHAITPRWGSLGVFFFFFCLVWLVHPEQSAAVCKTSRRRKTAAQMGLPYNQTQDEQYTTVKRVSTQAINLLLAQNKSNHSNYTYPDRLNSVQMKIIKNYFKSKQRGRAENASWGCWNQNDYTWSKGQNKYLYRSHTYIMCTSQNPCHFPPRKLKINGRISKWRSWHKTLAVQVCVIHVV